MLFKIKNTYLTIFCLINTLLTNLVLHLHEKNFSSLKN